MKYGSDGLLEHESRRSLRATASARRSGVTATHDTRIGLPFPTAGGTADVHGQFNGGPLGGTAAFQRYTTELRAYAPLGQFGGEQPGSQPMEFVLGLTARAGAVFGNTGPFFSRSSSRSAACSTASRCAATRSSRSRRAGYDPATSRSGDALARSATRSSRRRPSWACASTQQFYLNAFFDARQHLGHARASSIRRGCSAAPASACRSSRRSGRSGSIWAYGFDRTDDRSGRPDPEVEAPLQARPVLLITE